MERALANQLGKRGKLDLLREMLFDVRRRNSLLPRSKAAADPMPPVGSTPMQTQDSMHNDGAERIEVILVSRGRMLD